MRKQVWTNVNTKFFGAWASALSLWVALDFQKRNADAAFKAVRIVGQTGQDVLRHQVEIVQVNACEVTDHARSAFQPADLKVAAEKNAAYLMGAADKAAAQVRELSEIAVKGGNEAIAVLKERAEAGTAEFPATVGAAKAA